MILRTCFFACLLLASHAAALASGGYFRQPSLAGDTIVFTAEGDLWQVRATGGRAARLTSHAGLESHAAFSPDGKRIAFTATYEGPAEVYVMPAGGGLPKRLTWIGLRATVAGWTPQGEVLFATSAFQALRGLQLAAVHPDTGAIRRIPLEQASDGAFAEGGTLYFTRHGLAGDNVRAYRGGAMPSVWRWRGGREEAVRLTPEADGGNQAPMPWGSRLVVLSDRSGVMNLWSLDREGRDAKPLTRHRDFEAREPSLSGDRIAYRHGADIRLLDLRTGEDRVVPIELASDFEHQRERWVRKPMDRFASMGIAPNGERVAVAARGRVATAGTGTLRRVELPVPSASRARFAAFMSDGKQVAVLGDSSGEVELWLYPADGTGPGRQLTKGGDALRWRAWPSPDGRWIAHSDIRGRLWLTEVATATTTRLDETRHGLDDAFDALAWSPDSSALAAQVAGSAVGSASQVVLYRLPDRARFELTSPRYMSGSPVFSPDGQWLWFLSDRTFVARPGNPWGDRNMGPAFDKRGKIYAIALQPGLRFPFLPKDELEAGKAPATPAAAAKGPEAKAGEVAPAPAMERLPPKPKTPAIAWEGLAGRLYEAPLPAANYAALGTDGKRLWWLESGPETPSKGTLRSAAIDNLGAPPETFMADVAQFAISADGKKVAVRKAGATPAGSGDIHLLDAAPKAPADLAKFQVRLADWQFPLQPREDWRQLFADAWRLHRDHFYDRAMHGADWPALRRKYEPLVERVTDRDELSDLLGQMVGELGALHSQVGQGDLRRGEDNLPPAILGARFARVAEGARIEHLYRSDPEVIATLPPLAKPEVGAKEGETIVAVDGRAVKDVPDVSVLLRDKAGKQVLLEIRGVDGASRRAIVVPAPASQLAAFQRADREWANRRRVEEASGGRFGYIDLRSMTAGDLGTFAREFYPVADREGLVIDVRGNGGGSIDSILIEKLMRRAWAGWQTRDGLRIRNMQNAFRGPVVVLIDQDTYSDGETFAEGMKRLGLGTVIGKRTSGAGVWLSDRNRLADGGIARAAELGQYASDGTWIIEGVGVVPDIEVDNPPREAFDGKDAQLERALAVLREKRATNPVVEPAMAPKPAPARR